MSLVLSALAQETPRELTDAIVRPGWLGLGVFLLLVVAAFFLFRSMNRQLKKIDFDEDEPPGPDQGPGAGSPPHVG